MAEIFEAQGAHTSLVVIFHGFRGSPRAMRDVVRAVRAQLADADVLVPELPFGGWFGKLSCQSPARIAVRMVDRIDAAVRAQSAYRRILLVGYSFGAFIARKVAVIAAGEHASAPFELELVDEIARVERVRPKHERDELRQLAETSGLGRRCWGDAIERIVLLAGFSRGWSAAASRDWVTSAAWALGAWFGEALRTFSFNRLELSALQIQQGAPFVVQTRLQWLALILRKRSKIEVVQLLGAADDLLAPNESVDWAVEGNNAFSLVEVPGATHDNVKLMTRPTPEEEAALEAATQAGAPRTLAEVAKWGLVPAGNGHRSDGGTLMAQARWMLFGWALTRSLQDKVLNRVKIARDEMADTPAMRSDPRTTDVVFVIHGIRDHGFWTHKIARVIKREVKRANEALPKDKQRAMRSFTGSYGYFAMVPFILPWVRRWKTSWLMDHYTEARALYPDAAFSYVGHSNGTYLLARALTDYPAARFNRVVFAGSVVRRDYDWRKFLLPQREGVQSRVSAMLNYVATRDWVVALLPKGFQPLRVFDVGSAGHDGFDQSRATPPPQLHEARCVIGSHSAGISETQWDDIAAFVVNGRAPPKLGDPDFQRNRSWLMVLGGWMSPVFIAVLLWLVVGTGVALFKGIDGVGIAKLPVSVTLAFSTLQSWTPAWLWDWSARASSAFAALQGAVAPAVAWVRESAAGVPYVGGALSFLVSVVTGAPGWLGAALFDSQITTFASPPEAGASGVRAGCFAAYCWMVYLVATRF
ncbi:MAG TPA: alpha/beta hydrolase [Xanthobacteraceae bacterium]|nr:alpha/beta hydrolase [Xanthobacteraceae bacterium]